MSERGRDSERKRERERERERERVIGVRICCLRQLVSFERVRVKWKKERERERVNDVIKDV